MKHLILIVMLLMIGISCYAQGAQESYTLLMLEFEDRTGLENPLLEAFNDTIDFVLSRQTGPVQVRVIPESHRDALLARAAVMQPDKTPLELGLLVAEWVDVDALTRGSYTKQGELWSLEAEVYHRREGIKTRQEIQIQGDNVYKLLDGFPAHLLQQFKAGYIALTTDSWKAYEEFRKGHQESEYYNHFGALEHYDEALALDPTLALAYAEKSRAHATIGQPEQATMAIREAQKWLSKASPMEQLAIRSLAFTWDAEQNEPAEMFELWRLYDVEHLPYPAGAWTVPLTLAPGGLWDEPLLHQLVAFACMQEGKRAEADQHHQQWFKAIQTKLQAHPEDALLLHRTASYCAGIGQYLDEAIRMELKAIELNTEANWWEERYILSRLYELNGDMEQALEWAKRHVQHWPDPRSFSADQILTLALKGSSFGVPGQHTFVWDHLAESMYEGRISPERLLRWCEDVLSIPELHQPFRIRTQYLIAEVYHAMNDDAKMEAILTAIGAPHESDWMAIGPLNASEEETFPETPPFAILFTDLTATHAGILDEEMQWKPWEDEQPLDGLLNIWGVFNRKYYDKWPGANFPIPSIVYSCIYVKVPTAMEVQVRTGSGLMRVWLNDNPKPVIEVNTAEPPILDKALRNISLAAGLNAFLVAMVSSNSMAFYFRITDRDDNPIPGLEFVSAKEALALH